MFGPVFIPKIQSMKCPKCGHRVDLNRTIRKLREADAKARRHGLLDPPNPELWPLHVRVKMDPDKMPELVVRFCQDAQVKVEDVFSESRLKQFVIPRHVLMWWVAENSHLTVNAVGRMFGRHHASVVHARQSVERLIQVQDKLIMFHVELVQRIAADVWPASKETALELAG